MNCYEEDRLQCTATTDTKKRCTRTATHSNGGKVLCERHHNLYTKIKGSSNKNLVGTRFGRWTVISKGIDKTCNRGYKIIVWICLCDCGKIKSVVERSLKEEKSKSCGCLGRENLVKAITKHGMSKSSIYQVWNNMIARCFRKTAVEYENYGGRGIDVCDKWMRFSGFFSDMGKDYSIGKQIDRIDNNGNYSKDNCKWSSRIENCRNTTKTRHVTAFGETKSLAEWVELSGSKYTSLLSRIDRGWDIEKAISTPYKYKQDKKANDVPIVRKK